MKTPRLDAFQIQVAGAAAACSLLIAGGWTVAANVATQPASAVTRTVHHTSVVIHTHQVTVKVKGRVIRRRGEILVVYVPRTVVRTKGGDHRRIVIPAHVVRIRRHPTPSGGVTSLVVPPAPITVTVPVTVTVPGPAVTVTDPPRTVTETLPQVTTTVTLPAPGSGP